MNDFPKVLTLNREARVRIAIGMKSDMFMRCRPAKPWGSIHDEVTCTQEDEESWSATRDRLLPQLDSDKPIPILCESDLIALRVAVDSNPLGRSFRGWKKIERMLQDCWISYFKDDFLVCGVTTTVRFPTWSIQQLPRTWNAAKLRGMSADFFVYDECGVSFKWPKPKFTIKDALRLKREKQEERNEALKKFNPDPTKRRKR